MRRGLQRLKQQPQRRETCPGRQHRETVQRCPHTHRHHGHRVDQPAEQHELPGAGPGPHGAGRQLRQSAAHRLRQRQQQHGFLGQCGEVGQVRGAPDQRQSNADRRQPALPLGQAGEAGVDLGLRRRAPAAGQCGDGAHQQQWPPPPKRWRRATGVQQQPDEEVNRQRLQHPRQ